MMTTIFGIALAPLFAAMAQVESDDGRTSNNIYQISDVYIDDVNRITEISSITVRQHGCRLPYSINDKFDRAASEAMMATYWLYYGTRYMTLTGERPTVEVFARIHNGGPDGWKKPSTIKYWHKVKAAIEAAEAEGAGR